MKTGDEILALFGQKNYKPLSEEELVQFYNYKGKEAAEFLMLLDALSQDGLIFKTKKGKYVLPEKLNLVVGTLSKHKKGFGFLIPDTDKDGDVFIGVRGINGAMHGDKAVVQLVTTRDRSRSREGEVVSILRRANTEIIGTLQAQKKYGFVIPEDKRISDDIFVEDTQFKGAESGDLVVVKITRWPINGKNAEGKVVEIIGRSGDSGNAVKGLIRQYNLTEEYPHKALADADNIKPGITEEEIKGRRDLRDQVIITIDGADAKDLDDAVSVIKLPGGNYKLGVHIADVTHYVKEDSALDLEALNRGCSVYLIDKVIPMLPKTLSNGLCSLNPKVDRLTLSIEMEIDSQGRVISHDIFESMIRTTERMVYTDVSDILEHQDPQLIKKYAGIYKELLLMAELAVILRSRREERGSIDFDFDESYITLNAEGIPTNVEISERRTANRLIEEFMLKANEVIAEAFFWMEAPFVYRVHEKPSTEKMAEFQKFILNFGYHLKGNPESIHTKALNEIIKQVVGKPEEHVISLVMLRSMKKAIYSTDCNGHFGLGVKYYCHFTSPIRRYPDLLIHRIIKETMSRGMNEKRVKEMKAKAELASRLASEKERIAEELEREVEKMKKAEYMAYHIGETYAGIISGVVQSGFFVELTNTIEGMVRADSIMDDYYRFEPEKYRLVGDRSKKTYGIGDQVRIKVLRVDLENREIDFELTREK
jgi:ribonuclease R